MKNSKCPFSWGRVVSDIVGTRLASGVGAFYNEKTGRCWIDIEGEGEVDFPCTRSEWVHTASLVGQTLAHAKRKWECA